MDLYEWALPLSIAFQLFHFHLVGIFFIFNCFLFFLVFCLIFKGFLVLFVGFRDFHFFLLFSKFLIIFKFQVNF
jgi:hypothetical protein